MSLNRRAMSSPYLEWAKLHSGAKYNLATSGILSFPLQELPVTDADLEINGDNGYGYGPLVERIASNCGVPIRCVVTANGTAMANHLAMAALLKVGDDVLIERPTYGPLLDVASYLGANILRFERRRDEGFEVDLDDLRKKLTPKTRLVVLTNPHNPSGVLTNGSVLCEVGNIAAKVGASVLVDEVYLDMVYDVTNRSCFRPDENFIVTSSLTKTYGLSGLRCGWILAESRLAKQIWRLNDLFGATPPHPTELLSVIAMDNLHAIRGRVMDLLGKNKSALDNFLQSRSDLETHGYSCVTVAFPKLKYGSANDFCVLLRDRYETSVVPGHFFEMPEHFRIGIGGEPKMVAEGLERVGHAVDDFRGKWRE